jgi:hypothetical protein
MTDAYPVHPLGGVDPKAIAFGHPVATAVLIKAVVGVPGIVEFSLAPGIAHGLYVTIVLITAFPGKVDCSRENSPGRMPNEVECDMKLAGLRIP